MAVGVIGTGYVGLVAAACFADSGRSVICTDSNSEKLEKLKMGSMPFFEPGLEELIQQNHKRIQWVSSIEQLVKTARFVFVAVGTPELPDGGADLEPTFRVLKEIGERADKDLIVVLKSTVPIGTALRAQKYCDDNFKVKINIVSNPEFLRQGSALEDFLKPDRIVIGTADESAAAAMRELYEPFLRIGAQLLVMDNTSAEMVKYTANSFLALKISFINEMALLADKLGADIENVKAGFTSDNRINPAFFNPGIGYGGSCFPKDVRALIHTANQMGMDLKLLQATDDVNERQKNLLTERLVRRVGSLEGKKIGLWGLAFKPRTDDVRRAPSIKIIEDLVRSGAQVVAYDPVAGKNAQRSSLAHFELAATAEEAVKGVDALLIVTEWSEFKGLEMADLKGQMRSPLIFDGRNLFDPARMAKLGFEYYGVGRQVRSFTKSEVASLKANPLTIVKQNHLVI